MMKRDRVSKAQAKAFETAHADQMRAIHAQYAELADAIKAEPNPALRLILLDEAQAVIVQAEALQVALRRGGCRRAGFEGLREVKASLVANRADCNSAIAKAPLPGLPLPPQGGLVHG